MIKKKTLISELRQGTMIYEHQKNGVAQQERRNHRLKNTVVQEEQTQPTKSNDLKIE